MKIAEANENIGTFSFAFY